MRPHTFGFGPPGEHPSIVAVMLTTSFSMRTTAGNASPCSGFECAKDEYTEESILKCASSAMYTAPDMSDPVGVHS
eukprot:10702-Pelagococcus_subviridis.AAC.1